MPTQTAETILAQSAYDHGPEYWAETARNFETAGQYAYAASAWRKAESASAGHSRRARYAAEATRCRDLLVATPAAFVVSGRSIDGRVYAMGELQAISWTHREKEAGRYGRDDAETIVSVRKIRNAYCHADFAIGRLEILPT